MKMKFSHLKILIVLVCIGISCQKPVRNLYPETLVGGLELMSSEITGIDFNNAIKESEKVNHLYYNQIYSGAGVAIGDINNDGLADIFFCGNQVSDRLYLNKGDFKFEDITKKSRAAKNSGWSWGVTMADVNNDGYLDIYVSRNGESMNPDDRKNQLYINNQDLTFTESAMAYGLADAGFSSQAVFFDMDNDGDLDMYQVNQMPDSRLFQRYTNIPKKREIYYTDKLYKNENGRYIDASKEVGISRELSYGLSVSATDFNNDGWMDLYVANDYDGPDFMYYNNGVFSNSSDKLGLSNSSRGLWWSITANDLDNDGDDDYIIGNLGLNNKFKATEAHPFKVYANDFDNNGTNDVVLAKFYKDDYVPLRGKECTSQQMPYVSEKFKDYHSFASSNLLDILPKDKLSEAVVYQISNFESVILINEDDTLKRQSLPIQAQISPIKASLVDDFNHDGFKDILVVGNHFGVEVETTRYDAGIGSVFLGDGKNNFHHVKPTESGFYTPHDVRSINWIKQDDKKGLIVTNNNAPISVFNLK